MNKKPDTDPNAAVEVRKALLDVALWYRCVPLNYDANVQRQLADALDRNPELLFAAALSEKLVSELIWTMRLNELDINPIWQSVYTAFKTKTEILLTATKE